MSLPAHGALHGLQHADLRDLSAVHCPGYPYHSIDEVFIDITSYLYTEISLRLCNGSSVMYCKRRALRRQRGLGQESLPRKGCNGHCSKTHETGCGRRTHCDTGRDGYRRRLWAHLLNFWRVGRICTQARERIYDGRCCVARSEETTECHNEDLLYRLFGVQAELLIDHAWGWEPARMEDIKSYRSKKSRSAYGASAAKSVHRAEGTSCCLKMADALSIDLAEKRLTVCQANHWL